MIERQQEPQSKPLIKAFQGKAQEVSLGTWIIASVFVARFIFMTLRFD